MISEQTVLNSPVLPAVTGILGVRVARRHLAGIGTAIYQFAGSVRQWFSIPVLPYVDLWEASLIAVMWTIAIRSSPIHFPLKTAFLTDSWLRG
jgi:hypothetical protein